MYNSAGTFIQEIPTACGVWGVNMTPDGNLMYDCWTQNNVYKYTFSHEDQRGVGHPRGRELRYRHSVSGNRQRRQHLRRAVRVRDRPGSDNSCRNVFLWSMRGREPAS